MAVFFDNDFREIPLATWKRAELFNTFRDFADSRFNVGVEIDAEPLHHLAKARGDSFFLLALFAISKAYNSVPEMRQRFFARQRDCRICGLPSEFTTDDG